MDRRRSVHSQETATAAGDAPPAPAPFGAIASAPAAPKAGAFSRLLFWRQKQESSPQDAQATDTDSKDAKEKDSDIPSGIPDPQDVAHLSPAEQKILTDQTAMNPNNLKVSYFDIFKFATPMELFLNAIGLVMAIAAGATAPLMVLVFGKLTNNFVSYGSDTALSAASAEQVEEASRQAFASTVNKNALYLVYISIGMLGATYIYSATWLITGERITRRIREAYMRAILRQNSAFFDIVKPGEIATRIVGDTHLVQKGISTKVPMTLQFAAQFIGGFIVAFIVNWKITVVLLAIFPAISVVAGLMGATETKSRTRLQEHLAACGSLAEEAISSIRTVHSFQIHSQLAKLYSVPNLKAKNCAQKQARATAAGIAGIYFCVFSSYALAFWYGSTLYLRNEASVGDIITCFFAVIIASFSLSQAAPNLQAIASALGAANKLLLTIWRVPPIDSASKGGLIPEKKAKGVLEFRNVDFYYPSRPTVKVLDNYSLGFQPGQTTALAGTSGAGKSSVIALIERFYNPVKGEILLDGIPITDYNLRWLRSQIGLVAQEPTLFSCTVWENVAYGLCGTPFENASEAEKRQLVEKACKLANAHEFIEAMHKGYDTPLGERGMLVSGGQKQRLAIARAIVGDPPILLLDEATSALDTTSEKIVQNALDQAAAGRTTIAIAHRLSTIKSADKIAVMAKGRVLEVGTHTALLENPQGAYSGLVQAQALREQAEGVEGEEKKDKDSHTLDPLDDPIEKGQLAGQADLEGAALSEQDKSDKKKPFWRRKTRRIAVVRRILAQAPEMKWYYALAFVCSLATGMVYPVTAIIFGNLLYAFTNPDRAVVRAGTNHFAGLFFASACVSAVTVGIQAWCLEHAAAFLATRMRSRSLDATLAQEIAFFDETEHSTGALTSDISDSPEKIKTAFGNNAGVCIQGATVLVGGCIVGLAYTWKVALVAIACLPFMLSAGFAELTVLESNDERSRKSHEGSAQIACENAMAIKTVASLTRESAAIEEYCKALDEPMKIATRTAFISNAFFSASQSFVYPTLALLFWFGGQEVGKGNIDIKQFFITFDALTFGTMEAGNVFKLIPEISTALASARHMFKRFDSAVPQEQPDVQEVERAKSHGQVFFTGVEFNYPTRPSIPVLQGLDLQAKPGQFIALCGASGSGKTTVTQLLQRFYSPRSGSIKLDDVNISDMSIGALRGQMALVQQEPVLYDGSIKFNVGLGAIGEPSEEAISKACADANIAEFVSTLPDGLDTLVGARGSQLSGGQKQRLAIARALIRNPSILLLDEATSALDSQSEKVVQVALEAAAQARTTIAIAHRLSTIQNADIIYVLQRGKIVEAGTHDELQAQNGVYADLIRQQGLDR